MKTGDIIMKLFCLVLLLGAISSIVLLVFKLQNKDDYEKKNCNESKEACLKCNSANLWLNSGTFSMCSESD